MSGLTEDLIEAGFPYLLLQLHVVLFTVYEKNPASHSYTVGQDKSILVALSDNCGYSLILLQNLTSGSFLTYLVVMWNLKLHQ